MSYLTTNPGGRAAGAHRPRIVAEAVVSAYINEITPTQHRRDRAHIRHSRTDLSPRTNSRASLACLLGRTEAASTHHNNSAVERVLVAVPRSATV